MREEDVRVAVLGAFQTHAVLIAFARRIDEVEHLADRAADEVLRETGLVFGPVRFHEARAGVLLANRQTDGGPEVLHDDPEIFGGSVHAKPALLTVAHHLGDDRRGDDLRSGRGAVGVARLLLRAARGFAAGRHDGGTGRNVKTPVIADRRHVGRNFQIGARRRAFVLNTLLIEDVVHAENGTAAEREEHRGERREAERIFLHEKITFFLEKSAPRHRGRDKTVCKV